MTNRWLTRMMGGIAALSLSAALVLTIAEFEILNGKRDAVLAAACPTAATVVRTKSVVRLRMVVVVASLRPYGAKGGRVSHRDRAADPAA